MSRRYSKAPPQAEEKPLHDAARNGDVDETIRLLAMNPASINERDRHSRTPLHMAAWAGQTDVVKLLCDSKADIKAAAGDDMAAIHFASQKGHVEAVRLLLAARAEVNTLTRKGMTPLHMAVQGNHKDVCLLLIKKGANLLTKNKAGKTPLDLVKDEALGSCMKAAEAERRALKDSKKKKEGAEGESATGASDITADVETEKVNSTAGVKREGPELVGVEEGQIDEATALKGSNKKAKIALSHLDADEREEDS